MTNFAIVNSAVTTVKPIWLALADNGAILPGVEGRFIVGNPTGQLNTVRAKTWPKGAESWEPTSTGAVVRTANGKVALPDMAGVANLQAGEAQAGMTTRVAEATGDRGATVDGRELAAILLAVAPCAAGLEKAVISNVLLRITPGASVAVATDGYKLVERVISDVNGATFDAMINAYDAKHLAALLKADGYPLARMACIDGRLTIIAGNVAYFGPTIYATFPAYNQIIPATCEGNKIVVNVKELLANIKAATLKGTHIRVEAVSGYGIRLASRKGDDEAMAHCAADVPEDWSVSLDAAFLTQTLKSLACESVAIYPNGKLGPIVVRPLVGDCRAVVIPINAK